jgi:CubicO group peptidase (beta-lactamase class C family)
MRQVVDMTTAIKFAEDEPDPVSENYRYSVAMGWRGRDAGYEGPENSYEFLPTMAKNGVHGERFAYLTPNTDVLAWVMKRLVGKSLAEIMHERLWSRLGAERDAMWVVGPAAVETAGSGLLTTLPDMARFGQMLLDKGAYNGQQIVPVEVVADIERGGDKAAFARSAIAGPGNQGASYHHQWWMTGNDHGAYYALGYGGQILWIDPAAEMVVAKFSSYPTPTPDGREFFLAIGGIMALGNELI